MKHKSLSQMNKERKRKPMTIEEEYRNADVPMPNELLNASNTEEFTSDKSVFEDKTIGNNYKSGGAYKAMMKLFADNLDDEKFVKHCKKFFKGKTDGK
jgi:hypothetical protein